MTLPAIGDRGLYCCASLMQRIEHAPQFVGEVRRVNGGFAIQHTRRDIGGLLVACEVTATNDAKIALPLVVRLADGCEIQAAAREVAVLWPAAATVEREPAPVIGESEQPKAAA